MKTDVIEITPKGKGMERALTETDRAAAYRGLEPKQALRLRLLAEEMTGMLRTLIGDEPFRYWAESDGTHFSLHLATEAMMTYDLRKALLEASSTGKNAAAKGFMGRLRDIFARLTDADAVPVFPYEYGYGYVDVTDFDASMVAEGVSGRRHRKQRKRAGKMGRAGKVDHGKARRRCEDLYPRKHRGDGDRKNVLKGAEI